MLLDFNCLAKRPEYLEKLFEYFKKENINRGF
jgi:hypothetical protein